MIVNALRPVSRGAIAFLGCIGGMSVLGWAQTPSPIAPLWDYREAHSLEGFARIQVVPSPRP